MPVPDYQSLMLPLMEILGAEGTLRARSACDLVAQRLGLSESERASLLPSGAQTVLDNRVGWAKTYLSKAGLIESPKRGLWQLSERGREVLTNRPKALSNRDLALFEGFAAFAGSRLGTAELSVDAPTGEASSMTPTEVMETAYLQLRDALVEELLTRIKTESPAFFERLVVDLMLAMGYGGSRREAGEATRLSGDGGIDGVIREDRLGLDAIYLQAKRWEDTVGRPEVQKFAGAPQGEKARKGVMISTSKFSKEAHDYVKHLVTRIVLIDGPRLAALMIDHGVGVTTRQHYEVKIVDGDYFEA